MYMYISFAHSYFIDFIYNMVLAGAQAMGHVVPSRPGSLCREEVTVHNTGIRLLLPTSVQAFKHTRMKR